MSDVWSYACCAAALACCANEASVYMPLATAVAAWRVRPEGSHDPGQTPELELIFFECALSMHSLHA